MKDWTPEQRAEAVRKSKETRERNRQEREARKAGREAKPTRRTPITRKQVEHGITAIVVGVDAALAYAIPQTWVTPEDRLNPREVEILTEAFSTEAMKSPRVMRFLASLTQLTERLGIIGALMIVALPRLTRRGLIPRQWVPVIRDLLGAATEADVQAPPAAAEEEPAAAAEPGPEREAA